MTNKAHAPVLIYCDSHGTRSVADTHLLQNYALTESGCLTVSDPDLDAMYREMTLLPLCVADASIAKNRSCSTDQIVGRISERDRRSSIRFLRLSILLFVIFSAAFIVQINQPQKVIRLEIIMNALWIIATAWSALFFLLDWKFHATTTISSNIDGSATVRAREVHARLPVPLVSTAKFQLECVVVVRRWYERLESVGVPFSSKRQRTIRDWALLCIGEGGQHAVIQSSRSLEALIHDAAESGLFEMIGESKIACEIDTHAATLNSPPWIYTALPGAYFKNQDHADV